MNAILVAFPRAALEQMYSHIGYITGAKPKTAEECKNEIDFLVVAALNGETEKVELVARGLEASKVLDAGLNYNGGIWGYGPQGNLAGDPLEVVVAKLEAMAAEHKS